MKLALVLPGGVDRGGVDRVIHPLLWLIERLARRHEVHVFATGQEAQPGDWELLGARVHDVGTARGVGRRLLSRFATEHRKAPFDVVHAFFGPCGMYAAAIGFRYRVPVLFHAAGGEFVSLPDIDYGMRQTLSGRMALRAAVAGARRVTVATRAMQALAKSCGVSAERVPLGVALDRWPRRDLRARDTSRPAQLLHVGDLRPVKDQYMLLSAANLLHNAGIAFELDIVGRDTMDGALQRSSGAARVDQLTRWHGDVRHDRVRALMERADLLLVTSRHEAGPVVVLEAAIAGVPTVGTAVGHITDWAGEAAVAVPVGDAAALARETAILLSSDGQRLRLAREAQRRALAMDADFTVSSFENIYASFSRTR